MPRGRSSGSNTIWVNAEAYSQAAEATPSPDEVKPASHAASENPNKLAGSDLRHLAYRRGIAKSSLERMSDVQIRRELNFLVNRQYEHEMG